MSNKAKVAVLLAAYNGAKYIQEQLDSILNQQCVELSIIISVDKCDDSTLSIVNRYALEHPSIFTILDYGKSYGSAGKNFTRLMCEVDFTPYDYISFSDQDDIWLPNKLDSAVAQMLKNDAVAYSSNVTCFWESGKKELLKKCYNQTEFDYLFESPGPGCTFMLTCNLAKLMQTHLYGKLKQGKTFWMHDWYCYSFTRFHGYKWFIDPNPMMLYRQHEFNTVGANSGLKAFINRFNIILSGEGFSKAILQARFIGQESCLPIKLISSNNRLAMINLFFISLKCRRQPLHKIMFSIASLIFFIKGFNFSEND
jgi:rhamnosyltransferase